MNVREHRPKKSPGDIFELEPQGKERKKGGLGDGGKRKRSYLGLIPGLCLENKRN